MSGSRRCILLALLAVGGASCGPHEPGGPAPEIDVDACSEPVFDGGPALRTANCVLSFGAVPVNVQAERRIAISDPNFVDLTLSSVHILGDPSFKLVAPLIDHVAAHSSADLVVDVTPSTHAEIGPR